MRDVDQIVRILGEQKGFLRSRYKVKDIAVFGSFVRCEQKKKSDADILVEFAEPVGMFDFFGLRSYRTEIHVKSVASSGDF